VRRDFFFTNAYTIGLNLKFMKNSCIMKFYRPEKISKKNDWSVFRGRISVPEREYNDFNIREVREKCHIIPFVRRFFFLLRQ